MRVPTGRREPRTPRADSVGLLDLDAPQGIQKVVTENVSTKGVRVIADLFCAPGEHVVFMVFKNWSRAPARVVYCQPLKNGKFAVGLELETDAAVRETAH